MTWEQNWQIFLNQLLFYINFAGSLAESSQNARGSGVAQTQKIDFQDDSHQQLTAQIVFFGMSQLLSAVDLMINGLFCPPSI